MNLCEKRQEFCDVVAIAAGEPDGKRGTVPVDDHMVRGAKAGAVDRREADVIALSGPGHVSRRRSSHPGQVRNDQ
jgi:hypothetical protein